MAERSVVLKLERVRGRVSQALAAGQEVPAWGRDVDHVVEHLRGHVLAGDSLADVVVVLVDLEFDLEELGL